MIAEATPNLSDRDRAMAGLSNPERSTDEKLAVALSKTTPEKRAGALALAQDTLSKTKGRIGELIAYLMQVANDEKAKAELAKFEAKLKAETELVETIAAYQNADYVGRKMAASKPVPQNSALKHSPAKKGAAGTIGMTQAEYDAILEPVLGTITDPVDINADIRITKPTKKGVLPVEQFLPNQTPDNSNDGRIDLSPVNDTLDFIPTNVRLDRRSADDARAKREKKGGTDKDDDKIL